MSNIEVKEEVSSINKINNDSFSFVSLKDLNKIYPNGIQAVYDFNIDINKNDFIVLVGPSGCGKSTTLRMVAGLEDITSGSLYIDNELSNYKPSKNRDISMVFQNYALYPQMTVFDNIAFPLKARKYRCVLVAKYNLAYNEVIDILNNRLNEFIDAQNEANDKNLLFGTVVEYIATKLKISDQAVKILCNYKIYREKDLLSLTKSSKTLKEDIISKVNKLASDELNKLRKKGFEINDKYYVLKNGEIQYAYQKMSKQEIRQRVFNAAEILDLGPYLDRRPKELSGGQMQRVALGRAIVRNAKLFLMDEPLSNLDAKLRVQMRSEIVRIHEQIGATTIYVTHDQTEAMTMATKIVVMSKGWVQQVGTPQEIYDNPRNIFVATFIGAPATNIFNAEYENGVLYFNDGYKVKLPSSFKEKHDQYYKDQIMDLERMLDTCDFKKMHALKVLDKSIFETDEVLSISKITKSIDEVIKLLKKVKVNNEFEALLIPFVNEKNDDLLNECQLVNKINTKKALLEVKQIVDEIDDQYGNEAQTIINNSLENLNNINFEKNVLNTYNEFVKIIDSLNEFIVSLNNKSYNKLLLKLKYLDIKDKIFNDSKSLLLEIRRPLLTFEKIPSKDIGKLHNAQVFSKKEIKVDNTLYYQKPKNNIKKVKVQINLNSVDIEFINNLYEVALNLLNNYKNALTSKHGVRVGVRPEDIHLNNEFEGDKTESFKVNSNIVELLGSELLIHTNWNKSNMIAKISTGTLIKPHSEVELAINRNKILIFDESSGDTI